MKNIKQFNDFAGEDGYLIVDGLTNEVEGGRKKLSDVKNEIISEIPTPAEQVNADWNAESGKAQILNVPDVLKEIPEPDYSSGGTVLSVKSGELRWDWPQIKMSEYVDNVTIDTDANDCLCVLNPIPDDGEDGDVLTLEYGEPTWKELEIPEQEQADWDEDDDTEPSFIKNKPEIPTASDWGAIGDGSGSIRLNNGYITLNFDEDTLTDSDDKLAVAVPVPSPYDVEAPASDGDVLTYSNDEIIWKTIDFPNKIQDCDNSSEGLLYHQSGRNEGYYWLSVGDGFELDTNGQCLNLAVRVPDPNGDTQAENGSVLTYDANSDEIVWAAPQGGLALPDVQELIGKNGSDGPTTYENLLELAVEITVDEDNNITNVSSPRWRIDKERGSGAYYYFN